MAQGRKMYNWFALDFLYTWYPFCISEDFWGSFYEGKEYPQAETLLCAAHNGNYMYQVIDCSMLFMPASRYLAYQGRLGNPVSMLDLGAMKSGVPLLTWTIFEALYRLLLITQTRFMVHASFNTNKVFGVGLQNFN